jgi:hypothetical protein
VDVVSSTSEYIEDVGVSTSVATVASKAAGFEVSVFGRGGLRENMSRMLLRLSNSGISLPEIGSKFFVDHSCNLLPSLNIPGGFMTSSMAVGVPFTGTSSLKMA